MATLDADRQFATARRDRPLIARFESPSALVSFLASTGGSLDEKDDIYRELVQTAQDHDPQSDLGSCITWLGLWPGLDAIYRRNLRFFPSASDELVSELCGLFTSAVAKADLGQIRRVAATLVGNVERDLRRRLRRTWDEERRLSALPDDDALDTDGVVPGPWACDPSPGVDASELRAWLDAVVGRDAGLLERVLILGETQKEAGAHFGLSHDVARKRFRRALGRLSHSVSRTGVFQGKGTRRS